MSGFRRQEWEIFIPVNVACICKVGNIYRFNYDGFRVELEPDDALRLYCAIENALQKSSPENDKSIGIKVDGIYGYLDIKREYLIEIYRFFQMEERSGKAIWGDRF